MNYQDINASTIDRWAKEGWEWGRPISHEVFEQARQGQWDVLLTPTMPVPHSWFGEMQGKDILGLACGGGQQMPVFAALQANCTVLDYSAQQLESDRLVAQREGYAINIVRGDMTKPLPFADESFDLIFHPVSNCYVEKVLPIWQECYRVLRPGGVLLAGMDNGLNFAFDAAETTLCYTLPFNPLINKEHRAAMEAEDGGYQFSHTIEEQIGGQLLAGFRLTHLYGDTNGTGPLHEHNVQTYWATRAIKEKGGR